MSLAVLRSHRLEDLSQDPRLSAHGVSRNRADYVGRLYPSLGEDTDAIWLADGRVFLPNISAANERLFDWLCRLLQLAHALVESVAEITG